MMDKHYVDYPKNLQEFSTTGSSGFKFGSSSTAYRPKISITVRESLTHSIETKTVEIKLYESDEENLLKLLQARKAIRDNHKATINK